MINKQHLEEIWFAHQIQRFRDDFIERVYKFLRNKCHDTEARVLSLLMWDVFKENGFISLYESYRNDDMIMECILYLINSANNKTGE